jgi:hypothetical protein
MLACRGVYEPVTFHSVMDSSAPNAAQRTCGVPPLSDESLPYISSPLARNLEAPCFLIIFKLNSLVARVLLHLVLHSVKHGVLFQLLDVLGALGPTAVHKGIMDRTISCQRSGCDRIVTETPNLLSFCILQRFHSVRKHSTGLLH